MGIRTFTAKDVAQTRSHSACTPPPLRFRARTVLNLLAIGAARRGGRRGGRRGRSGTPSCSLEHLHGDWRRCLTEGFLVMWQTGSDRHSETTLNGA